MTGTYAKATTVPIGRRRDEIENTLRRYEATEFQYGWTETEARVGFAVAGRRILYRVPLPSVDDPRFARTATGRPRRGGTDAQREAYETAVRQRWAALSLVIKAKLEAVDAGISTIEQEFLAHILLPGTAETVGDRVAPALAETYRSGARLEIVTGRTT